MGRAAPASRAGLIPLLLVAAVAAACGKKGAPLAPVYLVPASVTDVSARRVEDSVRLRFVLPTTNVNGPGIDLDRVEIYAVTVAPGGVTPPNRELLSKPYLAGAIAVKPPPVEAETAATDPATEDKRPAPGDAVTFTEPLTPQAMTPPPVKRAPVEQAPARPGAYLSDPVTGLPVTPLQKQPGLPVDSISPVTYPVRIYVVRGIARNGRPGPPSARLQVPLGSVPAPPVGLSASTTEKAVILEWVPAPASVGPKLPAYNVYRADAPADPLNSAPIAIPSHEQAGAALGEEICFRVRTVDAIGAVPVEGALSDPVCLTPKDVFPPAAPKGVAAVATPGAVQLIWDANPEGDLAGYLVLRGEAPGETLQPLTPAPIRDTVYRDATVKPGVSYVYAIVAVDSATPPNASAQSERAAATAR